MQKMSAEERMALAKQTIAWTGDLSDDCTAIWAGLMLRAEWMDEDYWWWSVYDIHKDHITIENSNEYTERFVGGAASRKKAEEVAKNYIALLTERKETGKYLITDTFKITGRGLILAGQITEGIISPGDSIEFRAPEYLLQRKITAVECITFNRPNPTNIGILIKCKDDFELEELSKWKPENTLGIIYKI